MGRKTLINQSVVYIWMTVLGEMSRAFVHRGTCRRQMSRHYLS